MVLLGEEAAARLKNEGIPRYEAGARLAYDCGAMKWPFLHRWYMPFAWLAASSLISVPLAMYYEQGMVLHRGSAVGLAYGNGWALRSDVLASMIPYLLNLGTVVWLINADGTTRWGAFWATMAALARIIAPFALILSADVSPATGQHYVDWHTLRYLIWFQDLEMFILGGLLWLAFRHFVTQRSSSPAPAMYYAEA